MARLKAEEQQLVATIFPYLITPSGAKVVHSSLDLAGYVRTDRSQVESLLNRLTSGSDRILRPVPPSPSHPEVPRYEIFHDRLGQAILSWIARFKSKEAAKEAAFKATVVANSPLSRVKVDDVEPSEKRDLAPGLALSLSGGGYRAMLFHLGALWRLNELGLLQKLDQVSSVSTGSFVAAKLGAAWHELEFDDEGIAQGFVDRVVLPVRSLASRTIDLPVALLGLLTSLSGADKLSESLASHLLGDASMSHLPEKPHFVLVSSNRENGAVWRFSRTFCGDYQTGRVQLPTLPLAVAAAASAAQPPVLSPMSLRLPPESLPPSADGTRKRVVYLTDGVVLDRLAIETVWNRYRDVLVSDGSGDLRTEEPPTDWARQSMRVLEMVDWHARSVQKRQLLESFRSGDARVPIGASHRRSRPITYPRLHFRRSAHTSCRRSPADLRS